MSSTFRSVAVRRASQRYRPPLTKRELRERSSLQLRETTTLTQQTLLQQIATMSSPLRPLVKLGVARTTQTSDLPLRSLRLAVT
jgi:hypothetical protein